MVSVLALFVAIFAAPAPALAQSYGYGYQTQQTGWGYNPYTAQGMYSYYSPLAQYGYGNGYNPGQSTYTGQGYGYGAYGYNGFNPYTGTSYNNYNPYLTQGCSFYSYGYQPCQNQNTGSGPQIGNVSGPNSLTTGQSGTWSITTSAAAGNQSVSVRWGDENQYGYQAAAAAQSVSGTNTFSHTYQQAGTYTITFTVTDGYGRSNSASATVTVSGGGCTQNCSGNVSATPTSGQAPLAVSFTATGSNGTYYINFGDGQNAAMNPAPTYYGGNGVYVSSHTYTAAGSYVATVSYAPACSYNMACTQQLVVVGTVTITVTATNGNGCATQTCGLSATPTSGSAPLAVHFTGGVPGTSYRLDFGDGSQPVMAAMGVDCAIDHPNCAQNFVISINQDHTYAQNGTYTARVTGANNVSYTATIVVGGSSNPQGALSATPTSGAAPLAVNFSTSGIVDNRYFYTLDYGDGSTPATMTIYATTAQHTYTQNGTYTATLKAAPNQCYGAQVACTQLQPTNWTTVGTATITVGGGSTSGSNFSASPASGSWPLSPTFTATNLDSAGTYYVDFGDRSGSQWLTKNGTTGTISHVYYITGTFTATLVKVTCNGAAYTSSCSNPTQTPIATASISVN